MKHNLYVCYVFVAMFVARSSYAQKPLTHTHDKTCENSDYTIKTVHFQTQNSLDIMGLELELTALRYVLDTIFPNYFDYDRPLRFVIPDQIHYAEPPLLLCELAGLALDNQSEFEDWRDNSAIDALVDSNNNSNAIPYYSIYTQLFSHPTAINIHHTPMMNRRKNYNQQGNYYFDDKVLLEDTKKYPRAMYKILSNVSNARAYQGKYYVRISFTDVIPTLYKIYDFQDKQAYTLLEMPDIQETVTFIITLTKDSAFGGIRYGGYYISSNFRAIEHEHIAYSSYVVPQSNNKQYAPITAPYNFSYSLYASSSLIERKTNFRFSKK